jgi:signal transduction histidine kinase
MGRRAKPAKVRAQAKPPAARKARTSEGQRIRDLEKRLAEALGQLQTRNRELGEAQEQQAAMGEILMAISTSPADVQPVFDAIVRSAVRLCGGVFSIVVRFDGELIHFVAHHNFSPGALLAYRQWFPRRPSDDDPVGRTIIEHRVMNISNVVAEFRHVPGQREDGVHSVLLVPMLRDGASIGVIGVSRMEIGAFPENQVQLLKTFADQAVIAIENVRLFNELQEKNRAITQAHAQVSESLEQRTATSEILRVISGSPTDTRPVFETIAQSAVRLCGSLFSAVYTFTDGLMWLVSHRNFSPDAVKAMEALYPARPRRETAAGRAILDRRIIEITDVLTDPEYGRDLQSTGGWRSTFAVPMLRQGTPIGAIAVGWAEPGRASPGSIALLQTFADQAVIAIENARLFNEWQARNRDLTEALERQTATSEILRVISSFQTDVQPVFDAIAAKALDLCRATTGWVYRFDGELIHIAAAHSLRPEAVEVVRQSYPMPPSRGGATARAVLSRTIVYIPNIREDNEYRLEALAKAAAYLSVLAVPMLLESKPIGVITVTGAEAGAFSQRQIELLQTFADQAVIAVENVRLFRELEARTADLTRSVDQLTALGEVGRAVSSTLDLETVLTTIVSRAVELSGLDGGVVFEYDEDDQEFVQRAQAGTGGALAAARQATRIRKGEGVVGRTAITLEPVQVFDITAPGAYVGPNRENLIESGVRAILAVPMVREGQLIGCLGVTRNQPGEFPTETIELLRTFATQSALAIQNARLFQEIEDKSRQLETASRHKSEFLANMSHELRTPLNAIIGFSEVLSERMFGDLNEKQEEYLRDIHASGQHLLSLINDILDLSKIEAGRMELEPTAFDLPTAIENALTLVRERAARRGIALHQAVDQRLDQIRADERKIKQVLLNLLSNALKFTPEGGRIDVRAGLVDGMAEVSVADTGIGIAPEDQEAVFEEFRQVGTAAKKVEGTGLGLALSRKFIELHGGRIRVTSQVGVGATFTFTLPLSDAGRIPG